MNSTNRPQRTTNYTDVAPQTVYSLIEQLVNNAGVPERCIIIYDAKRYVLVDVMKKIWADFPDVRFMQEKDFTDEQKYPVYNDHSRFERPDWIKVLTYSNGIDYPKATRMPKQIVEAKYLVNVAMLKAHSYPYSNMDGGDEGQTAVTLTGKNNFGSIEGPSDLHGVIKPNPGIRYVKWDANRYVTQPGSSFLPAGKQSNLLVDYNFALLDLMKKTSTGYPDVMMMLCAGGSGRVDYGCLEHFHSFWPSDNTDPLKRVFIQWGFSHIFPANTISAHVTRMGRRPVKFAIDVALSGAYGVDLDLAKITGVEKEQIKKSIELYKTILRPIVQYGDLYRLVSPYENPRAVLSYVAQEKNKAVIFVYQTEDGSPEKVRLRGLDPGKVYRLTELNIEEGRASSFPMHGKAVTGKELMEEGFTPVCTKELESMVILVEKN